MKLWNCEITRLRDYEITNYLFKNETGWTAIWRIWNMMLSSNQYFRFFNSKFKQRQFSIFYLCNYFEIKNQFAQRFFSIWFQFKNQSQNKWKISTNKWFFHNIEYFVIMNEFWYFRRQIKNKNFQFFICDDDKRVFITKYSIVCICDFEFNRYWFHCCV